MVFFGSGGGSSNSSSVPAGYSQADKTGNIENQPDAFMDNEDDSDEDIGKQNVPTGNDLILNAPQNPKTPSM